MGYVFPLSQTKDTLIVELIGAFVSAYVWIDVDGPYVIVVMDLGWYSGTLDFVFCI